MSALTAKRRGEWASLPGEAAAGLVLLPLAAALLLSGGYTQWWGSPRGWLILWDTWCFSGLVGLVAVAAGACVARAGWAWTVAACVPLVLPASLVGTSWIVAWGRNTPWGAQVNVFDWPIAAAVVGLRYAGLAGLILAAQRRPRGPAARVFVVRWAWWRLGVRPILRPVLLAWLVVVMWSAAEPILPSMFLIHTYATQLLIQTNALLDPAGAVALAVPMLLSGGVVAYALSPRRARWTWTSAVGSAFSDTPDGTRSWGRGAVAFVVLAVTTGVPLVALIARVPSWGALVGAWRDAEPELKVTLFMAVTAAPCAAALGWAVAARWHRSIRRQEWTLAPWTLLIVLTPPTVLALGWTDLAGRWPLVGWRDTPGVLWLAYTARFAPVAAVVVLVAALRRSGTPDAAARVHGLGWWRRMQWVVWPARRRAVVTAAAVCALLVATELEMSLLLTPAGTNTVGVRLYTLIHTAPDAQVAAAALAILLTLIPPALLVGFVVLRRRT